MHVSPLAPRVRPWLELLEDRLAPATIKVTSLNDGPGTFNSVALTDTTLRDAIAHAQPGDTITFAQSLANGVVDLNTNEGGQGTLTINQSVTIQAPSTGIIGIIGGHGDGQTINGQFYPTTTNAQPLIVTAGIQVSLVGLQISNGYVAYGNGGGIANFGTLTLDGTSIQNNYAGGDGGGIFNLGTLIVEKNSDVLQNHAAGHGGGIFSGSPSNDVIPPPNPVAASLTISSSTIQLNVSGGDGGAVFNSYQATLTSNSSSVFYANTATNWGGGIFNIGIISVTDTRIAVNSAASGGGIYNWIGESSVPIFQGQATITNATIEVNQAAQTEGGSGGGVYTNGAMTLSGCRIDSNSAATGGGLYYASNTSVSGLTVSNCLIGGNSAQHGGGAFLWGSAAQASVTGTSFSDNSAQYNGGGLYDIGVPVGASIFDGNTATDGGGIWELDSTITSSTISNNTVTSNGGGIATQVNSSLISLVNSTVYGNSAGNDGGGIYCSVRGAMTTLTNDTIAGNRSNTLNTGGQGAGLFVPATTGPTLNNTIVVDNHNGPTPSTRADDIAGLVDGTSSFNTIGPGGSGGLRDGVDGNRILSSSAAGALGDPYIQTYGYGWSVLFPSPGPFIDHGNNSLAYDAAGNFLLYDQGGLPRVYNGTVDIGALEYQPATFNPSATSTVITSSVSGSVFGQQVALTAIVTSQGPSTPTGNVDFYDASTGTILGSVKITGQGTQGIAVLATASLSVGTHIIRATYGGDNNSAASGSSLNQNVLGITAPNLQAAINAQLLTNASATTITITIANDFDAISVVNAINLLGSQSPPITVNLQLAPVKYSSETINAKSGLTLYLNGAPSGLPTTLDPTVPALIVQQGNVIVTNVTFTESGDAPTILVSGGSLTLRNDIVQESTGYSDAAIQVTGGTLDLGSPTDPGGNVLNINGAGTFIANSIGSHVTGYGNIFEINGLTATLTVTNALDDGSPGSLRYEIALANMEAELGVPLVPVNFDSSLIGQTITLTQGQLDLSAAGGAKITVDASNLSTPTNMAPITITETGGSRIFGVHVGANAELDSLTIEGGWSAPQKLIHRL
jgi:hypothetical protein